MLKVGCFIESIDVTAGGTSTAFLNTLAALRTRPQIAVRAYTAPPVSGDTAWATVEAHRSEFLLTAGYGRTLKPGPLGSAVAADIEAGNIDLLHIHGVWSPDLLAAARACMKRGIRFVWEPHGMLVREAYAQKRWKKELFMALGLRRAFQATAGLVFVTAEERDHSLIPAGIGKERLFVVPLPVQMPSMEVSQEFRARARQRFSIPTGAPCVVFMGRLHPVKRIEMALRALAAASKTLPDVHLLLVGGGDEPYAQALRTLAAELGISQRVVFAGWVQGDDKWLALAAGEALTLNSVHENFGFVAVEALCVGTMPVLTSNLALAPELKAGGVGIVAEPDEQSLARAWIAAINGNRRAEILTRGRAWVKANLSTEAVGERLESVYLAVAKK